MAEPGVSVRIVAATAGLAQASTNTRAARSARAGTAGTLVLDAEVDGLVGDLVALDLDALEVAQPLQRGLERLLELVVGERLARQPGLGPHDAELAVGGPFVLDLDLDVELEPGRLV